MSLPFKALLTFESVVRLESFTAAARELHVTQSAVSHQVKNLEAYFGTRLLDRRGATVKLTEEGELLYQDLAVAMASVRRGVGKLKARLADLPIGISVRSHFALKWLSAHLNKANFDCDFRFFHSNEPGDFSDPSIHLSIEWLHLADVPDGALLLLSGDLTPACKPALLAERQAPYEAAMLSEFALLHDVEVASWQEWLELAGVDDLKPRHNQYYSDTNVRQQAAIEGQGFALVCPALVSDDLAEGRLLCPFDLQLNSWSYYLIVPPDRMRIPLVRRFVDWLLSEFNVTD